MGNSQSQLYSGTRVIARAERTFSLRHGAATHAAAKTARIPHGKTQHVSGMSPRSDRLTFVKLRYLYRLHPQGSWRGLTAPPPRLCSAKHCFRGLLMTLARSCRYPGLPPVFCTQNAALALLVPEDAALPRGGVSSSLIPMPHARSARQQARPCRSPGSLRSLPPAITAILSSTL